MIFSQTIARHIVLSGILIASLCQPISAQRADKPTRDLSAEEERGLSAKIASLNFFLSNQKWADAYRLFSNELKSKWATKADYVRFETKASGTNAFKQKFIVFEPVFFEILTEDSKPKPDAIRVYIGGCLKLIEGPKATIYQAFAEAISDPNGNWVFSKLPDKNYYQIDGGALACS